MINSILRLSVVVLAGIAPLLGASKLAAAIETEAREAILLDFDTGAELFSKNPDQLMPPASMTKMMTIYLLFERLKQGRLSLKDEFVVSEKAWRKRGSKMFVEVGKRVPVEDLMRGIVVQSGNDATIVVAEGLAGSEEAFAREMTAKAREIGMANTTFRNASGWPDPEHMTTARDLATLVEATVRNFPDLYRYYAEATFEYAGIQQHNRNPLLGRMPGADGLKTGHTEEAGYGLAASALRDGRRLILVVNGLPSEKSRRAESQRLLDWGFREFGSYKLFSAGETLTNVGVWLGEKNNISLVAERGVTMTIERNLRKSMKVLVRHEEPIPAPITKGDKLGQVEISIEGRQPIVVPLAAGESVPRLGVSGRMSAALGYLLWGAAK